MSTTLAITLVIGIVVILLCVVVARIYFAVQRFNPVGLATVAMFNETNKKVDAKPSITTTDNRMEKYTLRHYVPKRDYPNGLVGKPEFDVLNKECAQLSEAVAGLRSASPAAGSTGTAPADAVSQADFDTLNKTVEQLKQAVPVGATSGLTKAEVEQIVRDLLPHEMKTTVPVAVPPPTMSTQMRREVEQFVRDLLPHEMKTTVPASVEPLTRNMRESEVLEPLAEAVQAMIDLNKHTHDLKALDKRATELQAEIKEKTKEREEKYDVLKDAVRKASDKHAAAKATLERIPPCNLPEKYDEEDGKAKEALEDHLEQKGLSPREFHHEMERIPAIYADYRNGELEEKRVADAELAEAASELRAVRATLHHFEHEGQHHLGAEIHKLEEGLREFNELRHFFRVADKALRCIHEPSEATEEAPVLPRGVRLPKPSSPPVRRSSPPRKRQATLPPAPFESEAIATGGVSPVVVPAAPAVPAPAAGEDDSSATIIDPDEPDVTATADDNAEDGDPNATSFGSHLPPAEED